MLEGKHPPGERVVVFDAEGYFMGAGLAEKLAGDGFSVELVTPHERVAPVCDETLEGPLLRQHLHERRRRASGPATCSTAIEAGRVTRDDEFGEPLELEADAVVLVTQRLSNDALYHELKADGEALAGEGIEALYRIGDCVAPRIIAEAIFDGHRLAREIDSENPAVPLPYRRERLVLESVRRAPGGSAGDANRLSRRVREIEHDWLSLSDGTRLAVRIWLPEDAEADPVPAVVEYLPYRKTDGTVIRDSMRQPYLAGHGYAAVRVDMRGTGESDGVLTDEYTLQEQADALEVIAWLREQPWCDGNVGLWGISWGGFNSLQIAALRPPGLGAIMTMCSTDDRYADDVHYRGGCVLGLDMLHWASSMLTWNARPPDPRLYGDGWHEAWLERLETLEPWIEHWLGHQRRDAYWKHGSVCEDYSRDRVRPSTRSAGRGRVHERGAAPPRRALRPAQGDHRALGARLPRERRPRAGDRVPPGDGALVRPLAEGASTRGSWTSRCCASGCRTRWRRSRPTSAGGPLGGRGGMAVSADRDVGSWELRSASPASCSACSGAGPRRASGVPRASRRTSRPTSGRTTRSRSRSTASRSKGRSRSWASRRRPWSWRSTVRAPSSSCASATSSPTGRRRSSRAASSTSRTARATSMRSRSSPGGATRFGCRWT